MNLATIFICLFWLLTVTWAQVDEEEVRASHQKNAEMMKHDGKKRVKVITKKNVKSLMKKNEILVVFFWVDNDKKLEKLNEQDMYFLETVAQSFELRKVVISTCEIMANQEFASMAELRFSGMIKIFHKGKVQTYGGQRSPDVLIPFIFKMLTPSVIQIKKKAEKKNFDDIDLVKVIAYVDKNSKEYKGFEEASYKYHPLIPFYYVTDAKIAKVFHLKKKNSFQIIKPFEKSISFPAKGKLTYESIVKFMNTNKQERLVKLRLENIHEIWAIDLKGYLVTIFANVKTQGGSNFFGKCKKLSKQFEKNSNLTFVWIEAEPFPQMIDYWRKSFRIDPLKSNLGVVNIHTQKSTWFELAEGASDQDEFKSMTKWLSSVYDGHIEFVAMRPAEEVKKEMMEEAEVKKRKLQEYSEEENEEDAEKDEL